MAINLEKLKLQIIKHEGIRLLPYHDTVNKLTIGVGRNLEDKGISVDEAHYMLDADLIDILTDLEAHPPDWWWRIKDDDVRARVMVEMIFNLGRLGLSRFVRTLSLLTDGDFPGAADEMLHSRWAQQVGQRAVTLSKMMRTGQDVDA